MTIFWFGSDFEKVVPGQGLSNHGNPSKHRTDRVRAAHHNLLLESKIADPDSLRPLWVRKLETGPGYHPNSVRATLVLDGRADPDSSILWGSEARYGAWISPKLGPCDVSARWKIRSRFVSILWGSEARYGTMYHPNSNRTTLVR